MFMFLKRTSLIALQLPLIFTRLAMSSSLNAAGLTPKESKSLQERQPNADESRIIQSLKELYSCKPKESSYDIYTSTAQFHDPLGRANGLDSVKAQFNGLAQIFSKADVHQMRLLQNPPNIPESTLLVDQVVEYHLKESSTPGSGIKTLNSLCTLERDTSGKVTKHTEEWSHEKTASAEDGGFIGTLNEARKKMFAAISDKLVSKEVPKKNDEL